MRRCYIDWSYNILEFEENVIWFTKAWNSLLDVAIIITQIEIFLRRFTFLWKIRFFYDSSTLVVSSDQELSQTPKPINLKLFLRHYIKTSARDNMPLVRSKKVRQLWTFPVRSSQAFRSLQHDWILRISQICIVRKV